MNFEKLKPWNWFKHEEDSTHQVPVTRAESNSDMGRQTGTSVAAPREALGSVWQLQQEMDRLFDNVWRAFGWPATQGAPGTVRSAFPLRDGVFKNPAVGDFRAKLDVSANDNEYEVSLDVPGLSQDDIQIELSGNVLSIKGRKEAVNESKDKQYYRVERSVGSFQRTLT